MPLSNQDASPFHPNRIFPHDASHYGRLSQGVWRSESTNYLTPQCGILLYFVHKHTHGADSYVPYVTSWFGFLAALSLRDFHDRVLSSPLLGGRVVTQYCSHLSWINRAIVVYSNKFLKKKWEIKNQKGQQKQSLPYLCVKKTGFIASDSLMLVWPRIENFWLCCKSLNAEGK